MRKVDNCKIGIPFEWNCKDGEKKIIERHSLILEAAPFLQQRSSEPEKNSG